MAKEEGVIAGLPLVAEVFDAQGFDVDLVFHKEEGERFAPTDVVFTIQGKTADILSSERIVLNFLQRFSGIASETRKYVQALAGSSTKILDTRKTLPGFRTLDKYAVKVGGGENHRQGLFDMVLIKDNHIKAAGSVLNAVKKAKQSFGTQFKIEAEVENIEELKTLLRLVSIL